MGTDVSAESKRIDYIRADECQQSKNVDYPYFRGQLDSEDAFSILLCVGILCKEWVNTNTTLS
jgi:hypothetical protein